MNKGLHMDISRRHLLGTVALGGVAASAVGCAQLSTTASQLVTDANTLASGLAGIAPSLSTITGAAASTITTVQGWIADAQAVAQKIATAAESGLAAVAPLASQMGSLVNSIVGTLGGGAVTVPSWLQTVLTAAQTLAPIILSAAGIALAAPLVSGGMTPAQARAVLKAASA